VTADPERFDRLDIAKLLIRYARAIDDRSWEVLHSNVQLDPR